jgi:hypothetical protein
MQYVDRVWQQAALHLIALTDISAAIIIISITQNDFILFERSSASGYNIFQTVQNHMTVI